MSTLPTPPPPPASSGITKIPILGKDTIHCGTHIAPYIVHTILTTLPASAYVLVTDEHIAGLHLATFKRLFEDGISSSSPTSTTNTTNGNGSASDAGGDANKKTTKTPTVQKAVKARFLTYTLPPGEGTKSRAGKAAVEDFMLAHACTRDTVLIALGGGVVGDLVGFVAATFMRSIRLVQIPTTLLAMVDSAIGGKTAIDTPHGKNLIGAFHQPEYVFVDTAFLATLPLREVRNGLAEVVKTAAISSPAAFELLEANAAAILAPFLSPPTTSSSSSPSPSNNDNNNTTSTSTSTSTSTTKENANPPLIHPSLHTSILHSIHTKSHIVSHDPHELTGLRNLVNFGHTIGHAIEAYLTPHVLHGECVSIGMVLETEVARALGRCTQSTIARLTSVLRALGLPTSISVSHSHTAPHVPTDAVLSSLVKAGKLPTQAIGELTPGGLLAKMALDKKNAGSAKRVVLLKAIGETVSRRADVVPDAIILRVLAPSVRVHSYFSHHSPSPSSPSTTGLSNGASSGANNIPQLPPKKEITLTTPGSKSISNRALLLAALSNGTTRLRNLLHSDDTGVMIDALTVLNGASFSWTDSGETLLVHGHGGRLTPPKDGKEVYLGNAGTAARFLTGVVTLVSGGNGNGDDGEKAGEGADEGKKVHTVLTGNARMRQRPIAPLVEALIAHGHNIQYLETPGCLPLRIEGKGRLSPNSTKGAKGDGKDGKGGKKERVIRLDARVSSQYVSAVLMCGIFSAGVGGAGTTTTTTTTCDDEEDSGGLILELVGGQVISQPYIDMTIAMMASFGVHVTRLTDPSTGQYINSYRIPRATYTPPSLSTSTTPGQGHPSKSEGLVGEYTIESDASSASYPLALAALLPNLSITIQNIGSKSLQGDAGFAKRVLEPMGAIVHQSDNSTTVTGPGLEWVDGEGDEGNGVDGKGIDGEGNGKGNGRRRGGWVSKLKAIKEIDMEEMTDAFLTASVLAAVATSGQPSPHTPPSHTQAVVEKDSKDAKGVPLAINTLAKSHPHSTTITGIANQRVKECNRIRAIISQLSKFGVRCTEQPDGLTIHGTALWRLKGGQRIECYDDHRVAMCFSVLGSAVGSGLFDGEGEEEGGTVLEEKRCVEKTWPGWWDELAGKIGVKVEGVTLPPTPSHTSPSHISPSISPSSSKTTSTTVTKHTEKATAATKPKTLILIGMRGSGKTHIGRLAASSLGVPFVDADHVFEAPPPLGVGRNIKEFVREEGWERFREEELGVLKRLLDVYVYGSSSDGNGKEKGGEKEKERERVPAVLSLGGGIVETPAARALLQALQTNSTAAVIHVSRPLDEILVYLGEESARPAYGERVEDVYRRRQPWFAECSEYEFYNSCAVVASSGGKAKDAAGAGPEGGKDVRGEVRRFFGGVAGVGGNWVDLGGDGEGRGEGEEKRSYFLSLTYPDVEPALARMDELTAGVDAIELRVDLLKEPSSTSHVTSSTTSAQTQTQTQTPSPSPAYVTHQLALLRRATSLPIVYTVRTKSQGGAFPDPTGQATIGELFELLRVGVRCGVEYVDVELPGPAALSASSASSSSAWEYKAQLEKFCKETRAKGTSKIIASYHDWSGDMKWDSDVVKDLYAQAAELGDIVKLVGKATSLQSNFALEAFRSSVTSQPTAKPLIAINTGTLGQLSRILNPTLSPVTSHLLTTSAAPGQLSFAQIQTALSLTGLLPAKHFYLFGTPISRSPSPIMHNTAFGLLGLPHVYGLVESAEVGGEVRGVLGGEEFGGASVTIPLKVDVLRYLEGLEEGVLSESAKEIGAVNTIVVRRSAEGKRWLCGDNTDWIGIRNAVLANWPSAASSTSSSSPSTHAAEESSKAGAGDGPKVGLVIGAGGTARAALYALRQLGVARIYLYNRTKDKAAALAKAFGGYKIEVLDSLNVFGRDACYAAPEVIVSTVPGSATTTAATSSSVSHSLSTSAQPSSLSPSSAKEDKDKITLPDTLLTSPHGVVVEMAYRPSVTPLLSLAASYPGWSVVKGVDVLLLQGYEQFKLWTGREAPRAPVEERVWGFYNSVQQ